MAEHDIKVVVDLVDNMSADIKAMRANTEAQFRAVNDKVKESKGAFANLGDEIKGSFVNAVRSGIIAYAGFEVIGKITELVKQARAEYQEAERLQLKLSTALGGTSAMLNAQADALGNKLVIDNDEITAVQAMLANYVKNEEQIARLTPAVLDLAAATGQDMTTAANMVARAIADDGAEFGRYKISVDGAAESNERIDSIIRGVTTRMGGQAEAVAQTRDVWDSLGVKTKNVLEQIWGVFVLTEEEKLINIRKAMVQAGYNQDALSKQQLQNLENSEKEILDRRERLAQQANPFVGPMPETEEQKNARVEREREAREKRRAQQQDQLDAQQARGLMDQQVRDRDNYLKQQKEEFDRWSENQDKIKLDRHNQMLEQEFQAMVDVENKKRALAEKEAQIREDSTAMAIGGLQSLAQAHKEYAGLYKAAAIAQTLWDTYKGAQAVITSWAATGPQGLAIGIPLAAAVTAGGLARVQMIAAQQFAAGTGYAGGGTALVGEYGPEMVSLPRGARVMNAQQTRNEISNNTSNVTVNVLGSNGRVVESLRASLRSGNADSLVRDLKMALA
jgi:hypothetical protein